MLGVDFYSQGNGEVLASVQQPVRQSPFAHKNLPGRSMLTCTYHCLSPTVSTCSTIYSAIVSDPDHQGVHISRDLPNSATLQAQPNIITLQPAKAPSRNICNHQKENERQ